MALKENERILSFEMNNDSLKKKDVSTCYPIYTPLSKLIASARKGS